MCDAILLGPIGCPQNEVAGASRQRSKPPVMLNVDMRKQRARSSPVFDDKTIDAAVLAVFHEHIAS